MSTKRTPVLLVDDETEFLDSVARALSRRGFLVETAEHGEAALRLLENQPIDVVVLDVKMPGMDGVDVFREIKLRWPHVAVILLTGHGTVKQAFTTSKEGIFDYLTKPCDVDQLAKTVREAAASVPKRKRTDASRARRTDLSVLIVDDEPDLLDSLSRILSRRGITVATATSGSAALDVLQSRSFSVALLDVKMPGMNGFELMRRIKQQHALTEVIFLTGHPSVDLAVAGVRQGAFDYLLKPAEINDLIDKITDAHLRHLARTQEHQATAVEEILDRLPD